MRVTAIRSITALLSLFCIAVALPVSAQTYPTKPIRVVVPYSPGGIVDVAARLVTQRLAEVLGKPVVVENRTGASGTLGVDFVTKADPDGYTLLLCSADFMTTPSLMPKVSFDPYKDLLTVSMIATAPLLLVASENSGFTTLKDVLAAAKAAPGTIAFSSPGVGQINHLGGEWIGIAGGVKLLHVPYRGGTPAATAVATGEVQLGVLGVPAVMPYVQAGKARILGLLSKDKPSFLKDLPSLAEGGMPDIEAAIRVGLFVPTGTSPAIVSRLEFELQKILAEPFVRERLNAVGLDAHPLGPKAFAERIRADAEVYGKIIEQTGIKVER
jgi:tripartite-type tricarboxylate transporter receptor subunit TctC